MSLERKSNDSDRSIPDKHFLAYKQNVILTHRRHRRRRSASAHIGTELGKLAKNMNYGHFTQLLYKPVL